MESAHDIGPATAIGSRRGRARRAARAPVLGALLLSVGSLVAPGLGPLGALDRLTGSSHGDAPATVDAPDPDSHASTDEGCGAPPSVTAASDPAAPVDETPVEETPAPGRARTQTVTVVVPPIVRVLDESDGSLTVRTNAARPPAPGDVVLLIAADGTATVADDALTARVLAATWAAGSWCSTTAEHRSAG